MDANHVEVRHLSFQGMTELRQACEEVYPNSSLAAWNDNILTALLTKFPDG